MSPSRNVARIPGRRRAVFIGRLLLLALLVGMIVLSIGSIASAQTGASASLDGASRVDLSGDVNGAVGGATSQVDGALRDVDGVVDSTLGLSLDGDAAGLVDGLGVEGLDVGGLVSGDPAADAAAAPQGAARDIVEPRPLTTQETAVVGGMAAAASAGFLFWLQSMLGFGGARFMGAPLFSRIEKDALLDNEGREVILNLVDANPGIGLKQLSDRSGLGWGTTVYHASRLEQAGFVASMKKGQNRHFFKNGHPAARMKDSVAVLRNETAGSLARFLLETPGATQTTIARHLGLGAPTVTKYVKRMESQGLVEVLPMGRSKIVQPTAELQVALSHAKPEAVMPSMPVVPAAHFANVPRPHALASASA